jgi:hypothetical protein
MKLYLAMAVSGSGSGRVASICGLFLNEENAYSCLLPPGYHRIVVEVESDFSLANGVVNSSLYQAPSGFPFKVGDVISHLNNAFEDVQNLTILELVPCDKVSGYEEARTRANCCVWRTVVRIPNRGFSGTGCYCIWDGSAQEVCWKKVGEPAIELIPEIKKVKKAKRLLRPVEDIDAE